jgi:probable rRNA maturation factor
MIDFNFLTDFSFDNEDHYSTWLSSIVSSEGKDLGELTYVFCDDEYLHKMNVDYLNHDTLTDIITFDYCEGSIVSGDVFVSVERVKENAIDFNIPFVDELLRVMAHGTLHLCGYKDKSEDDVVLMRSKEDEKIKLFHVEQ